VPSDAEGLDVAAGIKCAPAARLALVAPSHATPLGGALPIARRLALLDWAGRANAWVLEDDCDSEFRWSGHPLPPLATLDRAGRVIYCGTFSKTLAPALRLGFAVVPAPLVAAFVRVQTLMDRGIDTINQATLAEFMRQGLLAPHIRRMRTEYSRRRDALLAALARHAPSASPIPAPGGLHMVCRLSAGADEAAVVQACRCRRWGHTTRRRRGCRGWSWVLPPRPRHWPPIRRGGWRRRCGRPRRAGVIGDQRNHLRHEALTRCNRIGRAFGRYLGTDSPRWDLTACRCFRRSAAVQRADSARYAARPASSGQLASMPSVRIPSISGVYSVQEPAR
jgi:hypothetical protein